MAQFDLLVIENNKQKRKPSAAQTIDFLSIKVGASGLEIKETTGHFDFSAKKLTNMAAATASGHAVEYDQLNTALALYVPLTQKGANNGVATLDSGGKIPASQLPSTVMEFKGQYNANTNSPALANGTGDAGDVYRVNVAGSHDFGAGSISFAVGDWVMYNGSIWEKAQNSNAVNSVNGQQGVVVLTSDDISEGTTNLYYTDGRFDTRFAAKTTDDLGEGTTNLYFTPARAKAAAVADAISDGVTDVAPSQNAVYDALALKQDLLTASNGVKKVANDIQRDDAKTFQNDNGSAITVRQVVYVKANGHVDKAQATVSALGDFALGLVEDASIAAAASGKITVRRGAIVGGFSGLTPGKKQYVSRATAGALTEDLSAFTTGESAYCVGRALSATEIEFDPQFEYEF